MKMNPIKKVLAGAGGVATLALIGAGIFGVQDAGAAGIANTKHNLGANGGATDNKYTGTTEICVFCHTPHGSDTTASVPLWNRKMSDATTYTTYNSLGTSSLDGKTAQVGSVSLACLSCHDGTQAMNTVINAPGSGKYNALGNQDVGAGSWQGTRQEGGLIGKADGTVISRLGQDLQNDHPVGIQYAGGPKTAIPASGDYTSASFNDPDFATAKSTPMNDMQVWWVNTPAVGGVGGAENVREKTDMLLYTRSGDRSKASDGTVIASTDQPFVECASCHDPHTEKTTFLRIENSGSAVCLACHIK